MSFSRLSSLPFRLTSKKNKRSYICDIGDIRFTVDDVNLLDGGPVTVQEPLTGVPAEYAYSMKLPALVSIAQQANAKEFALQRDLLSVMMCGRLTSSTTDSVGTITNIIHNGGNTAYQDIIANITYRIVGEVGNPNRLQGIISFDAFTTLPGGFSNTIIASVTDVYGVVIDIDDLLIYGTGSTVTVKKNFS